MRAGIVSCATAMLLPMLAASVPTVALGRQAVSIELVLAVDVSGSVDAAEQRLQRDGLARAFRDDAVIDAIAALPDGLAVAVVAWAGPGQQRTAVAWHRLVDQASAEDFAARLEAALPVDLGTSGYTALGDALIWSLAELAGNAFEGHPKIDVSGDGISNCGAYPSQVRDRALASGVTINGLAIVNENSYVPEFYRTNVIGGTGAFVVTADDYRDFAQAVRLKLLRELAPGPTVLR
ncbi:MAG TPA: DUF1194 domain-containing protein [Geminicoccus sp.]|uniref:DUF1194 domain-containing protein n=1 Tax=Geminicoccus sp. TaxID=2024832 RepID=UPI002D0524AD|nr:DUF1194 domain-containing protein [Geminicoccus sp.]HWL68271.1 DUF1194 domain-containing protein [Geminicoccus sp.]